jgi:hypothetical protein
MATSQAIGCVVIVIGGREEGAEDVILPAEKVGLLGNLFQQSTVEYFTIKSESTTACSCSCNGGSSDLQELWFVVSATQQTIVTRKSSETA